MFMLIFKEIYVYCLRVYLCPTLVQTPKGQKRLTDLLVLSLQMVMHHHVDLGMEPRSPVEQPVLLSYK